MQEEGRRDNATVDSSTVPPSLLPSFPPSLLPSFPPFLSRSLCASLALSSLPIHTASDLRQLCSSGATHTSCARIFWPTPSFVLFYFKKALLWCLVPSNSSGTLTSLLLDTSTAHTCDVSHCSHLVVLLVGVTADMNLHCSHLVMYR